MNKPLSILLLGAATATLAGCASEPTCDYSDAPYMSAQSAAALQTPEGLSALDRSSALTIPPTATGAPPPLSGNKTRCLDRPPSYFATGQSTSETSKDAASKEAEKAK